MAATATLTAQHALPQDLRVAIYSSTHTNIMVFSGRPHPHAATHAGNNTARCNRSGNTHLSVPFRRQCVVCTGHARGSSSNTAAPFGSQADSSARIGLQSCTRACQPAVMRLNAPGRRRKRTTPRARRLRAGHAAWESMRSPVVGMVAVFGFGRHLHAARGDRRAEFFR